MKINTQKLILWIILCTVFVFAFGFSTHVFYYFGITLAEAITLSFLLFLALMPVLLKVS